jgi:hypothetical protein
MGDSLGNLTDPRPAPIPREGVRRCEFCESHLTANGEVLTMSEKARALRTLEDRLAAETAAHATTKAQLAQASSRIVELETAAAPAPAPATRSAWGVE